MVKASLDDIKVGDFIGITAMPQPDGNADVESSVASVDGQIMMVKYSDGEKKIIVPPDTPVVRFVPGYPDDFKPGAQIFIVAGQKMPDGTVTAPAINLGRDGVAPPM
jgi:hypothetical protein